MEEALAKTTPFLTLDPVISNRLQIVQEALLSGAWADLISNHDDLRIRLLTQGAKTPEKRETISWDDANLFFLLCIDVTVDGKPNHLEAGISKERFGRFPYGDGSPLSYLGEWLRDSQREPKMMEKMQLLMEKITSHLKGTPLESGIGRIKMLGWLDAKETTQLRKCLTSRCWKPAVDEPLDGGCNDAAKHFVALLRAAEKRKTGVLLRVHR